MQGLNKYLDYIISGAIVLIPFSIAVAPAFTYTFMGILFFGFVLKKWIRQERLFISTAVNLPFVFLILISIFSFKNSLDYNTSLRGIIKLIQNAFLFLICAEEIKNRKQINRIIVSIILGVSLASFDALWQIIFGWDFIRGHTPIINIGLKRATAALPNANVLGVYLSAVAPVVIGLTLYYFRARLKIIMLLVSLLVTIGMILTFSRPAILALYISILFLSILRKSKAILVLLLVILLIFPFIVPKNIKDWAKSINYNPVIFMCNADRISIYKNAINMIKHHPIIGVGVNTFSKNYLRYKLLEPENAKTGDAMYAHNNFLHIAGEIGLLGLGIFVWFLFRLFKECMRIYGALKEDYLKVVSLSLTACLIAFLVNGLTETSLYYSRVAMIFWYLIGFSLSLNKFCYADRRQGN